MLRGGVNVFHPVRGGGGAPGVTLLLSLLAAVALVYQLRSVMHGLHLGNRPHTDPHTPPTRWTEGAV